MPITADEHQTNGPIGVFDSGIGGLSILRALRAELPHEDFVYVADSAHAPYGERDDAFVLARARAITAYLQGAHHIKALVVACNTATAAAIDTLRRDNPALPIIGVEPALKPAVVFSTTRRIAVLATRGTLESARFRALMASQSGQTEIKCQPCDGLADAIERDDTTEIVALCEYNIRAAGQFGIKNGEIDTLVLGCTHYPFASSHLRELVGPQVRLIDTGTAVAQQTRRVVPLQSGPDMPGRCVLISSGEGLRLQQAAKRWLDLDEPVLSRLI